MLLADPRGFELFLELLGVLRHLLHLLLEVLELLSELFLLFFGHVVGLHLLSELFELLLRFLEVPSRHGARHLGRRVFFRGVERLHRVLDRVEGRAVLVVAFLFELVGDAREVLDRAAERFLGADVLVRFGFEQVLERLVVPLIKLELGLLEDFLHRFLRFLNSRLDLLDLRSLGFLLLLLRVQPCEVFHRKPPHDQQRRDGNQRSGPNTRGFDWERRREVDLARFVVRIRDYGFGPAIGLVLDQQRRRERLAESRVLIDNHRGLGFGGSCYECPEESDDDRAQGRGDEDDPPGDLEDWRDFLCTASDDHQHEDRRETDRDRADRVDQHEPTGGASDGGVDLGHVLISVIPCYSSAL